MLKPRILTKVAKTAFWSLRKGVALHQKYRETRPLTRILYNLKKNKDEQAPL